MTANSFIAADALAPLKAFQRKTVDYVFDRFYSGPNTTRQFLVADEVGLGKTMVARGVIARMIEHLQDKTERIDILYICSNQAIASQNINRLNVLGRKELALPTRMTLIPLQLRNQNSLSENRVNFISLTPGTTFDLRSTTGIVEERALIFRLLEEIVSHSRGLRNLLQVSAGAENWSYAVETMSLSGIDKSIIERFQRDVKNNEELFQELERVCEMFPRRRESYEDELVQPRNTLIGRLRGLLSYACVESLQPDLIIMDEFQRFRDLLHDDSDGALLARELFNYADSKGNQARTLLLSATPYRMLTLSGDNVEEGSHYSDFLETLKFLYGGEKGDALAVSLERELREFRGFLHALPGAQSAAVDARIRIEDQLRQVIARTERVGSTVKRDSMVAERPMPVSVKARDLAEAKFISEIARILDAPEIIEYWKSTPYLLNFMRDYKLKHALVDKTSAPSPALIKAIAEAKPTMLAKAQVASYQPLDVTNGRMRELMEDVFSEQLEANLWIPPALPYYGSSKSTPPITKALVFSSWSMVPDSIAALLSYEAERRMGVGDENRQYFDQVRPRLLQFGKDQDRLTGLRVLLLIYPSAKLAELLDPLSLSLGSTGHLSMSEVRAQLSRILSEKLNPIKGEELGGRAQQNLEWSAPAVIDRLLGSKAGNWLQALDGMAAVSSEDGFKEHVTELGAVSAQQESLGGISNELLDLLVDIALGSPAICALRALRRVAPELPWDDAELLKASAQIAWGFRTLFSQHDVVALLRRGGDDRYWHRVMTYCAEYNLQAVLDEYSHYLVDAEGLSSKTPKEKVAGIAKAMASVLSVRPSQIEVDDIAVHEGALSINKFQMRGRFAMRLADYQDEDGVVARFGAVRDAFNSPFRPFVLATTSVGQEGLDFHPYCYRIYHWNLPSNPVDLEQREGRIHRFKGHAIRLNIAQQQSQELREQGLKSSDPWKDMFDSARAQSKVSNDLVPFWIYEGDVKVERRVPMLPFSREITRLEWLKRSLTVYRLAFGQPRQDDLLEYLQKQLGRSLTTGELSDLQISLEPRLFTHDVTYEAARSKMPSATDVWKF